MTEQNMIPAEKVRGVINEINDCLDGTYLTDQARRALEATKVSLGNILPTPPQPTTGLLGRWAKHDAYGDVVVISDRTDNQGDVWVSYMADSEPDGMDCNQVPLDSLTFPEQASRPEEVPAGEAWLVDVNYSLGESHKSIVALKAGPDFWRTSDEVTTCSCWHDSEVTLISPLVPERPESDLQAKYDALEDKYEEAQAWIEALSQDITPRTVTSPEEYDALPVGSQVRASSTAPIWQKSADGLWEADNGLTRSDLQNRDPRTVLRYGWGDEQPAWRIEHDPDNLRAGEYIIDKDGYTGTVTHRWGNLWNTDGIASGSRTYAPFIAFVNKDAATPEAIEEAKKARDKETGE